MDVLSEILRVVKLQGALFFNGEFSAPWCVNIKPAAIAPYVFPDAGRLIVYHFLTHGHAYVQLHDGRREEVNAGEVIVFPHGDTHYLGNGAAEPVDSVRTFAKNLTEGFKLARFGGGGQVSKFVCGFMTCEQRLGDVFLSGLPSFFKVHVVDDRSDEWLERSIRFSVDEAREAYAGSELVRAKLAELLFVETLRRYINALPSDHTGWLAGARDAVIGQALALLHKDPARQWTISELSRQVGLSRSRLAERFRYFLGESPIAYLAQWRLKLGAEILQSTDSSIAEVAEAVGYGSEAAFNRAFKRQFDSPPAQFRRQRRSASR